VCPPGNWKNLWSEWGSELLHFLCEVEDRHGVSGYAGEALGAMMQFDLLRRIQDSRSYRLGRLLTKLRKG